VTENFGRHNSSVTTPGANIILDTDDQIASGVYADIFRPSGGALVYKLFIGFRHHTTVSQGLTDPEDDYRRRKTFDSECRAYEIAGVFEYGAKASAPMEYIEGTAAKLRAVEQFSDIREAQSASHRVGTFIPQEFQSNFSPVQERDK